MAEVRKLTFGLRDMGIGLRMLDLARTMLSEYAAVVAELNLDSVVLSSSTKVIQAHGSMGLLDRQNLEDVPGLTAKMHAG